MFDKEIAYIEDQGLMTPVTFYSEKKLLAPLDLLRDTLPSADIYYALKSCYNPLLLHALVEKKVGAEVLSELEFDLAVSVGFKKIIVNGMGRSKALLEKAVSAGAIIIVDTLQDIERLKQILEHTSKTVNVGLRIAVESTEYPNNAYLHSSHPLGTRVESDFIGSFMDFCHHSQVAWQMLHAHFTINELLPDIYETSLSFIASSLKRIEHEFGLAPTDINVGGGYEAYDPGQPERHRALFRTIGDAFEKRLSQYKLAVEPGRYLSANAGYTIGTVLDLKQVQDKTWIISDIGTNTLIPIPNARYSLQMPLPGHQGNRIGLTDGITSPSNNVIDECFLADMPKIGDYICVGNTGAYTDVYSTFWAYTPHKVCFVNGRDEISTYRSNEDIRKLQDIYFH